MCVGKREKHKQEKYLETERVQKNEMPIPFIISNSDTNCQNLLHFYKNDINTKCTMKQILSHRS